MLPAVVAKMGRGLPRARKRIPAQNPDGKSAGIVKTSLKSSQEPKSFDADQEPRARMADELARLRLTGGIG